MSVEYYNPPEMNGEDLDRRESLCEVCRRELGRRAVASPIMSHQNTSSRMRNESELKDSSRTHLRARLSRALGDLAFRFTISSPFDPKRAAGNLATNQELRRYYEFYRMTSPEVAHTSAGRPF